MNYLRSLQNLVEERVLPLVANKALSWTKSDGTLVSSVDLAVQEELIGIIEKKYPDHRILYEEGEPKHCFKQSDFTWVIDPIDGTANFLEGKKEYSIAIGLMKGNEFLESLVIFPAYGESFYAAIGEGVYRNGERMPVLKPNPEEKEIVFCSRTYSKAQNRMVGYKPTFYRCATYSVLRVLTGKALAFHAVNTMLYDVGPISHIASEAGIECLCGVDQPINYRPDLKRIPIFLAVSPIVSQQLRHLILDDSES
ncbi:inositol monophosphatase [Scytonema tolypothrichoides VB-61278]|nr:inositol monophosphatase [Scytonema tolypothrichoides VB-61278]